MRNPVHSSQFTVHSNIFRASTVHCPLSTVRYSGFTLLEALVAVTIITLSVAGPLYAASRAAVAAQTARDQLIASYLAQEGIEYVRAMRDTTYLAAYQAGGTDISANAWNEFLNGLSVGSITACRTSLCRLDPVRTMGTGPNTSLQTCTGSNSSCAPLRLAPRGIYTQQTSIPGGTVVTPFRRTIQVLDIPGTTDVAGAPYPDKQVVSRVWWSFHNQNYSVTIRSKLTPWQ